MAPDLVGRGGGTGRRVRERASLARHPQGRRVRPPRDDARRMGALRFRARLGRRDRRSRSTRTARATDAGYILDHSESVGVLCEDEAQRAKVEAVRAELPQLAHVLTFAELDELAARGPRVRGRASGRAARGAGGDLGGRPLHVHLHVGHDRPAEGLHDLAPQLLRHGGRRGRSRPTSRPSATPCCSTCRSRTTSAG